MNNIKAKTGESQHILKVTLTDWQGSVKGKSYRTISVLGRMTLYQLARAINEVYNFYFDHCFGFYDNLKNWTDSNEEYELFKDIGEESSAGSVKKTKIMKVFSVKGKKMLFLFDYGDEWKFIVELLEISPAKGKYPKLIESFGKEPKQY